LNAIYLDTRLLEDNMRAARRPINSMAHPVTQSNPDDIANGRRRGQSASAGRRGAVSGGGLLAQRPQDEQARNDHED
jgi:hypothetical protein